MGGEVADGEGASADVVVHEAPQAIATGVVLHPARLEGGILAVVGKHQQPPPLGMVQHVLGQHMDIGHGGGADGAGGFSVAAKDVAARGLAGHTGG